MEGGIFKHIIANMFSKIIEFFIIGIFIFVVIYVVIDYMSTDAVAKYTEVAKLLSITKTTETKSKFKQDYLEATDKKSDIFSSTRGEEVKNDVMLDSNTDEQQSMVSSNSSDWLWPVPGFTDITSRFGKREQVAGTNIDTTNHGGMDISGAGIHGSPILAVLDGEVVKAAVLGSASADEYSTAFGNYVEIKHTNGVETIYAHCDKVAVKKGDKVKQGGVIAYVGNTGQSSGPHLHIAVKVNGTIVDPELYLTIPE